jgi:hypothetical protein
MKNKVISFRVNEDVFNVIESICGRDGLSKNELLSDIISSNINMQINSGNLTDLDKLLVKLKSIVMQQYDAYFKTNLPCIIKGTEDDGEYEGKSQILVGDDTLIREKNGKFYILDLHNENDEPVWMNEKEVLDFYAGQNLAYEFPMWEHNSYQFIRGFVDVAESLLSSLKEKLETNKK